MAAVFDPTRRVALLVVRRELGLDLREVIEVARAGVLEFAAQFVIVDRGAARFEKIAFRRCSHQEEAAARSVDQRDQLISATCRIKRITASRAASAAGCSGACERKLW